MSPSPPPPSENNARLDAVAKERDALRQEVTELRKSLENMQSKHDSQPSEDTLSKHEEEMQSLRDELEEANEGKEHFETQYKNLLGRVNTIKTSLGDRLKADAVGNFPISSHDTAEGGLWMDVLTFAGTN
jgi:septal ring factor EnvC (AmiA/AmiB activator)